MLLHQIFTPHIAFDITVFAAEDAVLLLDDGIYWQPTSPLPCVLYYLQVDAQSRGMCMNSFAQPIDKQAWIELVAAASTVKSWF